MGWRIGSWGFTLAGAGLWVILAASTLVAGPIQKSSNPSPVARDHIARAQQALDARDFRQARAHLKLALEADPNSAAAYVMLGLVDFQSGDTTQAIQDYQRALDLQPDSFSGHYNLALAYLRGRNLQEGLRELDRAISLNPRHADAAYNRGLVLLDLARPEEALAPLRRARALGPERPDVAFNLVRAELVAHRVDEARHEAEQAAKNFGADPDWRAAVGRLFLDQGQPHDAVVHLAEAVRLRPDRQETRRLLATAYLQSNDPAAALAQISTPTTAEDHYLRASALYLLRQASEAQQESRHALELAPGEPSYLLLRARIGQRLGRHAEALELLRQVTVHAPDWPEPYYSAGVSYYLLRRYEEARRSLARALELDPRSARALFLYAASLVNQGKNREAEEYLQRALALEPANARFHYHLGALLLRDNRPAEAQQAFEKAIRLKPDFAPPHYQLGKLLVRSNHPQLAVRELETAVQRQPELAQAYYQLSRAYALLGETEKSSRALAAFNNLKQQETEESQEFMEDVKRQLELPLPQPAR